MGNPNTRCRVCGKGYFCCADSRAANSWRTMACSPECYKEYMRRVWDARRAHPPTEDACMGPAEETPQADMGTDVAGATGDAVGEYIHKPKTRKKKAGEMKTEEMKTGEMKTGADFTAG